MTFLYTPLLWLVPALMGVAYAAHRLLGRRLSRPASRRAIKNLAETASEAFNDSHNLVRGTVSQIQHDGLSRRVRSWISRAAQAQKALATYDAKISRLAAERSNELLRRDAYVDELRSVDDDRAPYLGPRAVALLNTVLFLGDITIVSMAIQASDSDVSFFVSTAGALALAAALYLLGKIMSDSLKSTYDNGFAAAVIAFGIVLFSVGLYLLRLGYVEAWLILATAPALGAAGVSLLGPSRILTAIHRAEKSASKAGNRHETALKKRAKVVGRVEYLLSQARLGLVTNGYRAIAHAQMAGIEDALTSPESIANDLGISLGNTLEHAPSANTGPATAATSNGEVEHDLPVADMPTFVPLVEGVPGEGTS